MCSFMLTFVMLAVVQFYGVLTLKLDAEPKNMRGNIRESKQVLNTMESELTQGVSSSFLPANPNLFATFGSANRIQPQGLISKSDKEPDEATNSDSNPTTAAAEGEAAHEFSALNTLMLVFTLGLVVCAAYLCKELKIYYLPESAAAVIVGMTVGIMAWLVDPSQKELDFLTFDPQLFFFLLLPPIIFEAGYSLHKKDFFDNFLTICTYAIPGTLISTLVVGYLVYLTGVLGIIPMDTSSPMEALIFGALISAVDPVATLSILGNPEIACDPLLYSLVFGESVLNDAVSIVLFNSFVKFYNSGKEFTSVALIPIFWDFVGTALGSLFMGLSIALICSYLCKNTNLWKYPELEIAILFLFAYGSYALSEALELSGIFSLFFCGITLSHYNSYNLSIDSQTTANSIFHSLANISELFVFLYMGMGIVNVRVTFASIVFIVLAMAYCLLGRALNTFPLSAIANLGRQDPVPLKMQVVMWFSGLRGAIAFALSQNMPGDAHDRELYITSTLAIVVFTTVVLGGLTEKMLTRFEMRTQIDMGNDGTSYSNLGTDTPEEELVPSHQGRDRGGSMMSGGGQAPSSGEPEDLACTPTRTTAHTPGGEARRDRSPVPPPSRREHRPPVATPFDHSGERRRLYFGVHAFWKTVDQKYMKPIFGGKQSERRSSYRDRNGSFSSSSSSSGSSPEGGGGTSQGFEYPQITSRNRTLAPPTNTFSIIGLGEDDDSLHPTTQGIALAETRGKTASVGRGEERRGEIATRGASASTSTSTSAAGGGVPAATGNPIHTANNSI